jgi:integrase/recombinase XerD
VKAPKVRLYIRVRLPDGHHAYLKPAWNRNRTLRAGYALVGGQPVAHPDGVYYLRFLRGDKRVWQAIGPDADASKSDSSRRQPASERFSFSLL